MVPSSTHCKLTMAFPINAHPRAATSPKWMAVSTTIGVPVCFKNDPVSNNWNNVVKPYIPSSIRNSVNPMCKMNINIDRTDDWAGTHRRLLFGEWLGR